METNLLAHLLRVFPQLILAQKAEMKPWASVEAQLRILGLGVAHPNYGPYTGP